ncbi:MAG: hypothetical protein U0894_04740 [Pirellulales bacterium]
MSASDKAFIKAFAKMAPATESAPEPAATVPFASPRASAPMASSESRSSTVTAPRSDLGERLRRLQSLQDSRPAPTVIENVYAEGALYRMESPQPAEMPAPHFAPPANQATRRTVRRFSSRLRGAEPVQEELEKPAGMPPSMVRRMQARGLLEQARRMTGPTSPEADLIAPPIVTQESEPSEVLPPIASPNALVKNPAEVKPPVKAPAEEEVFSPENSLVTQYVDYSLSAPATSSVIVTEDYSGVAPSVVTSLPEEFAVPAPLARKPLLDLPMDDELELSPEVEAAISNLAPVPAPVAAPVAATIPASTTSVPEHLTSAAEAAGLSVDEQESLLAGIPATEGTSEVSQGRYYRIDGPEMGTPLPHHEAILRGAETATIAAEEEKKREAEAAALKAADEAAAQIEAARQAAELAAQAKSEQEKAAAERAAALELAAQELKSKTKKTCVPLWEVDRFLWPETVQKLLKDDKSYFMQAGAKLVAAAKDGLRTLAITGSRRGEGRSTLAMCLARCAAQSGISVAIIDADFQRPQLASQIGLEIAYGWQDAASGKIPLAEAAVKSIADRVTVLPLEASAASAPLSLANPNVTSIIRTAADTFDLVIIDLGPTAAGEEPLFPAGEPSPFDAVIVLRDLRYATVAESQTVARRLQANGVEAVGIAENYSTSE